MGIVLAYGIGVKKDMQSAKVWLGRAASQGEEDARNELAELNAEL